MGAQSVAAAPRVEVSHEQVVVQLVVAQPVVSQPTMPVKEKQILGRCLRLASPRFLGEPGEDTYIFVITCEDRLHNLGLVETPGMD